MKLKLSLEVALGVLLGGLALDGVHYTQQILAGENDSHPARIQKTAREISRTEKQPQTNGWPAYNDCAPPNRCSRPRAKVTCRRRSRSG